MIYLDHAATTPVDLEVVEAMLPYYRESYGNASGVHSLAQRSRRALDEAREQLAELLGASYPASIIFTGGGTEADNLAVLGLARAQRHRGRHLVTSAVEHHAVLACFEALEQEGFETTRVAVDSHGRVDPGALLEAVRPDTTLVSLMLANNEVGTLQPVAEVAGPLHSRGVLLHTDAVQGVGTLEVDVERLGVDALSLSAHKFYGPKGVGALYLRPGVALQALQHGGGQERGRRSGTENVPGVVGMVRALELAAADRSERAERMRGLRDRLIGLICGRLSGARLTGHPELRHPGIVSFAFEGAEGESMLLLLDREGIAASTGSACSTSSLEPSHVLKAMNLPLRLAHGSLRLSLGRSTTADQVDRAAEVVARCVEQLRELAPADMRP